MVGDIERRVWGEHATSPWKLAIFLYERSDNSAFEMKLSPCSVVEWCGDEGMHDG